MSDVLVVGGGVVGLFCAYFLRQAGASVAVVERATVGDRRSCSYGNTGFVGTQGAAPMAEPDVLVPHPDRELVSWLRHFRQARNDRDAAETYRVLLDLKKRGLEILRELCASGGLASTFTADGLLLAYRTQEGFEDACRSVPAAVSLGVPLRILSPEELCVLEPRVEFDIRGAVLNEEGAYVRVPEFLDELARLVTGLGVKIYSHADVVGFELAARTITTVRTDQGDFRAGEVVLAAGAWSAECARRLGIELALQPVKGYSVTVEAPPDTPRLPVLCAEASIAVAPLGDRLRLAGMLELSGMDTAVPAERVEDIRRAVESYLPGLKRTTIIETWSGLRPGTPDSRPHLGRVDGFTNLTVACGHGHIGMGLAPFSGKLVAQVVTGQRSDVDLAPFRVDRFAGSAAR